MPVKYIPYNPDPVNGQAILSSNSLLRYGRQIVPKELKGMPLYEVDTIEQVRQEMDGLKIDEIKQSKTITNTIFHGDCLNVCASLKDRGVKVDLVYIDPPFASGADYAKKIYLRKNPIVEEPLRFQNGDANNATKNGTVNGRMNPENGRMNPAPTGDLREFEETMYGDIWRKEDYLNWMYERLLAIREVMNETASIYVHLDWHIGHYVKILMDEIFGEENFRNEIVWHYDIGTAPKDDFKRKHDLIFRYSKSQNPFFKAIKIEVSNIKRYNQVDVNGRKFAVRGDTGKKIYADEGQTLDDVWSFSLDDSLRTLNSMAKESRN
jgi:adenine-specific DNA-methyltransferase